MRVYICAYTYISHKDNNSKCAITIDFIENTSDVWNTAYAVDNSTLEVIRSLFI